MTQEIKGLRRHTNWDIATRTKLCYPEHSSQSGLCSVCNMDAICEVGFKARTGKILYPEPFGAAQFAAEKRLPNLEDIQILPELFGKSVHFERVKTECKLGSFKSSLPICIPGLGSTRVACIKADGLSEGAAKAGIVRSIGENIFVTYGKDHLKHMIKSFLDSYHGKGAVIVQANANEQKLNLPEIAVELGAQGIELKFGQGAKQGLGGEIKFQGEEPANKYKKLGYDIIRDCDHRFERHAEPGSLTENILRQALIKYSDLKVPIWLKIGVGSGIFKFLELCQKIKKKNKVRLEAVVIDGHGGSTGMSPWLIMNETSVPSISALAENVGKYKFDVIVTGGFADGMHVAKALMMGADGVGMARCFNIAVAAIKEDPVKGMTNFVDAIKEELQMTCATQRVDDINELREKRNNLIALSCPAAEMFNLKQKLEK